MYVCMLLWRDIKSTHVKCDYSMGSRRGQPGCEGKATCQSQSAVILLLSWFRITRGCFFFVAIFLFLYSSLHVAK